MSKYTAWWKLGKPIWLTLLVGFIWVLISIMFEYKVSSSGAVLICACLISELLFTRLVWRKKVSFFPDNLIRRVHDGYESSNGKRMITGHEDFDTLRVLARNSDKSRDGDVWGVGSTAEHVEFVIVLLIAVSAIIGTILWGYG